MPTPKKTTEKPAPTKAPAYNLEEGAQIEIDNEAGVVTIRAKLTHKKSSSYGKKSPRTGKTVHNILIVQEGGKTEFEHLGKPISLNINGWIEDPNAPTTDDK